MSPEFWDNLVPMSQKLELPDRIFEALTAAARRDGLTAAEWLEIQLRTSDEYMSERPLTELLSGVIGVVDSSKARNTRETPFSSALAEKFRGHFYIYRTSFRR